MLVVRRILALLLLVAAAIPLIAAIAQLQSVQTARDDAIERNHQLADEWADARRDQRVMAGVVGSANGPETPEAVREQVFARLEQQRRDSEGYQQSLAFLAIGLGVALAGLAILMWGRWLPALAGTLALGVGALGVNGLVNGGATAGTGTATGAVGLQIGLIVWAVAAVVVLAWSRGTDGTVAEAPTRGRGSATGGGGDDDDLAVPAIVD